MRSLAPGQVLVLSIGSIERTSSRRNFPQGGSEASRFQKGWGELAKVALPGDAAGSKADAASRRASANWDSAGSWSTQLCCQYSSKCRAGTPPKVMFPLISGHVNPPPWAPYNHVLAPQSCLLESDMFSRELQKMTESSQHRWSLPLAFGLVYLFWGSTYLAIAIAVEHIPPGLMCATPHDF